MRTLLIAAALFLLPLHFVIAAPSGVVLEDFEREFLAKFPHHFRTYPFQRGKAQEVYTVWEEQGNHYLAARDHKNLSIQIFKPVSWNLLQKPRLSWRWRPSLLPQGGDERDPDHNDSACGVYVIFGRYSGHALKYVWSTQAPLETVVEKKPGKFYIIVKGSGKTQTWQTVSVDVVADYRKVFGKEAPPSPTGFAILSDGNASQTPAGCDYDDFVLPE